MLGGVTVEEGRCIFALLRSPCRFSSCCNQPVFTVAVFNHYGHYRWRLFLVLSCVSRSLVVN
jgi:hypothetical protein